MTCMYSPPNETCMYSADAAAAEPDFEAAFKWWQACLSSSSYDMHDSSSSYDMHVSSSLY